MHHYQDLIQIFNDCFAVTHQTKLVKGGDEPIYLPADEERPYHALCFAHGFFSSALHESAHWLIAGSARRTLVDFGYWYTPDGRTEAEQVLFQQVEVKPQALEWILAKATGYRFQVSIDNLNGQEVDTLLFKQSVYQQVKQYCAKGLSARAEIFRNALCQFYHTAMALNIEDFDFESL